jgi:hypothetical protein
MELNDFLSASDIIVSQLELTGSLKEFIGNYFISILLDINFRLVEMYSF